MTREEAVDTLRSACESELNTLWNFDSHIKYHHAEGENIIAAFKELFDIELTSPWSKP